MARKKNTKKATAAPEPAAPAQPAEFTPQPTAPQTMNTTGAGSYKYGRPQVRVAGQKREATSQRAEEARAASAQPTETEEK